MYVVAIIERHLNLLRPPSLPMCISQLLLCTRRFVLRLIDTDFLVEPYLATLSARPT
jgi:hypothetical protein